MNFQCEPILEPIKVIFVNPLGPAAQLVIVKILSGAVFGDYQMVDLCLLVYANEITFAKELKLEIESCAFSCNNSIEITSDLPSISDGDVFCFITNFPNPNIFDKKEFEEHFEDLYLIMKLASNFVGFPDIKVEDLNTNKMKPTTNKPMDRRKPIFMVDGLVGIDILKSLSTNLPEDVFFCPTPLTAIAKSILGEYLNVECNVVNDALVWAANDEVFHVEVEKPLIIHDVGSDESQCDRGMISKDLLDSMNLDHTQLNPSWMKREFIHKVSSSASKNPYGCIYRASEFAKTLRDIWLARSGKEGTKVYSNIGVISDGSIGTLKGYPYVLPVVVTDKSWFVNKRFQNDTHLKQEMKKINKEAKKCHQELISYCKRILLDNIMNQGSTPSESESIYEI
ncbi:uncharacterized protein [Epargyreus clarus]|uniref:uncharacterized protein n=1 Tax=Epargyreus clarus TaxID=520877 RepID=UPI003C30352B